MSHATCPSSCRNLLALRESENVSCMRAHVAGIVQMGFGGMPPKKAARKSPAKKATAVKKSAPKKKAVPKKSPAKKKTAAKKTAKKSPAKATLQRNTTLAEKVKGGTGKLRAVSRTKK